MPVQPMVGIATRVPSHFVEFSRSATWPGQAAPANLAAITTRLSSAPSGRATTLAALTDVLRLVPMDQTPKQPAKKQFVLQHPGDSTKAIAYGWEGEGGHFAVLFVGGRVAGSRKWPDANRRQARRGLIEWTIELGFFTLSDLDDAAAALDTTRIDKLPRRLRTLVDVVTSFGLSPQK